MSKQIKCKCGNDTFRITEIEDCSNCQNNGAYPNDDSEDLIYDDEIIKKLNLVRDQVNYEQTCRIGEAYHRKWTRKFKGKVAEWDYRNFIRYFSTADDCIKYVSHLDFELDTDYAKNRIKNLREEIEHLEKVYCLNTIQLPLPDEALLSLKNNNLEQSLGYRLIHSMKVKTLQ